MRLGLVIYGSLQTLSGGYLYDRKLVQGFERAGDEIEIVSLPWRTWAAHLADNLSTVLRRRLEGLRIDALLEDELNHPSLVSANRYLHGRVPWPIVSIVHHLRSSEEHPPALLPLYRSVERAYLASVDAFVFNSEATRRSVEALVGPARGVVALPAGSRSEPDIEECAIEERAREPGPLRVLFVGNLIARKGLHDLLDGLLHLPAGSWALSVVGDPGREPRYAARVARVARERAAGRVRFLGRLGDDELAAVFRSHHVLAVPSRYEGFGIVYLEAMAFGLPVLAGAAGGAAEIVTEGVEGFLVPSGDAGRIAAALGCLAADRAALSSMGAAARRRFLAHPRWEDASAAVRGFLRQMLDERKGGSP